MVFFIRIIHIFYCCLSLECSKDPDGVPPLVPHIFVKGENAKEGKKDSGSAKKVPEKCLKRPKEIKLTWEVFVVKGTN